MNARKELARLVAEGAAKDIRRAIEAAKSAATQCHRAGQATEAERWERIAIHLAGWEKA